MRALALSLGLAMAPAHAVDVRDVLTACIFKMWEEKVAAYDKPVQVNASPEDIITIVAVMTGKKTLSESIDELEEGLAQHDPGVQEQTLKEMYRECTS